MKLKPLQKLIIINQVFSQYVRNRLYKFSKLFSYLIRSRTCIM